jgi:hypothetical protein
VVSFIDPCAGGFERLTGQSSETTNRKMRIGLSFLPTGDVLPVRAPYNGIVSNIVVNPFTSKDPVWYAGPDLVAATLLTGRPPSIIREFRLVPHGQQEDLRPVNLRGMIRIDPYTDDFCKAVIEARARVKSDQSLPESEREALGYFFENSR